MKPLAARIAELEELLPSRISEIESVPMPKTLPEYAEFMRTRTERRERIKWQQRLVADARDDARALRAMESR